ncbi:MAG: hypothetical protein AAB964_02555, partial [Patescibacteria group bacterium]
SRRKERHLTCREAACGGEINDWTAADWTKTFELSSREEVDEVLNTATLGRDLLSGVVTKLTHIRNNKKPTSPEVVQILKQGSSNARKVAAR